ncbi:MAG: hypothetical protein C0618_09170 [Desulfuromonas sp.]|nr:MAG: hypothetical protein C0618_09170 [Desulfuromonas sp.]
MKKEHSAETLIEFPCHYQFKVVGAGGEQFRNAVVAAVERSLPVSADAVKVKPSKTGSYQSVSVVVTVHNYDQLKSIYADLRLVDGVQMLL